MSEGKDQGEIEKLIEGLPTQPEIEAFEKDEMIACAECTRDNPPNRIECLYCGVDLEISDVQSKKIKPALRKIEGWKNGVNLIFFSEGDEWNETQLSEASKMTRLNTQDLAEIVKTGKSLPLARVESNTELEIAKRRFQELGIKTMLFEDEAFDLDSVSKRLRTIEFARDKIRLTQFNLTDVVEIDRGNLFLVVIGARFEKKIESTEKYKRKGENKVLETTELSADEMLIDIYTEESQIPYRIEANGFDFSFLGEEKAFVVNQNIRRLVLQLRSFAPETIFDEDYLRVRAGLSRVWDIEQKTDLKGIQRKSFGKFNKERILQSDNLEQYTKYSRLQWHLLQTDNS